MLNIGAEDQHLPVLFDPVPIRAARMIMPVGGHVDDGIVDIREMLASLIDLQELKGSFHAIELDGEILCLYLHFKNLPEVANGPALAQSENHDVLGDIIGGREERKVLNVVPVKMGEGDGDLFLPVAHGEEILAEIPDPGACVHNGNSLRVWKGNAHTCGITAKFLKASITNGS